MKSKRILVSLVILMLLLFNLSGRVFADASGAPLIPRKEAYVFRVGNN